MECQSSKMSVTEETSTVTTVWITSHACVYLDFNAQFVSFVCYLNKNQPFSFYTKHKKILIILTTKLNCNIFQY